MANKPQNHVTRAVADQIMANGLGHELHQGLPVLTSPDLAALLGVYPQRCIMSTEDVDAYRWYAAKAELVQTLIAVREVADSENRDATSSRLERMLEDNVRSSIEVEFAGR